MFSPLEYALNVLSHDFPYPLNLALRSAQRISLARLRGALLNHQLLQRGIKARASIRRQISEVRLFSSKRLEELLLEIRQETKGDPLAQVTLGNDEERQAAC